MPTKKDIQDLKLSNNEHVEGAGEEPGVTLRGDRNRLPAGTFSPLSRGEGPRVGCV